MAVQIQLRNDTAANWTTANPVLAQGELGIETDTRLYKIGNGSTAWNSLAYGSLVGTINASAVLYTINDVAGTTYTILSTDEGRVVRTTSASAVTITVADALQVGEQITFAQYGAGQITFAPAGGVTLHSADTKRKVNKQYSGATLVKVAASTYWLFGDLAA